VPGSQNPKTWRKYWAIYGEKIRENPTYRPVLLILSDRQTVACVPHPMVLSGPDTSLQYVTSGPKR